MSIAQRLHAIAEHDAGFTLMEVIVAFMIFGIVASSATIAVSNGLSISAASRDRVSAANVAQQQIDIAQAMTPAQLAASTVAPTIRVGSTTYGLSRSLVYSPASITCPSPTAAATDTVPHYVTVAVTVSSPGPAARTVTMKTVLAC